MNLPADVMNEALDAAGIPVTLGDPEDGSHEARILTRAYLPTIQQILRAAHWNFARKSAALQILADASGQTPGAGALVVAPGWQYEYAYPPDCMKVRYVPWQLQQTPNAGVPPGNIEIPATPIMGNVQQPVYGQPVRPARFVISSDANYLPPPGYDIGEVQGISPVSRTVILSNVQNAAAIYTMFQPYPATWDSLFRQAVVAVLAARCALALHADKRIGMSVAERQEVHARTAIQSARATDGNEAGFSSGDIAVDWMRARNSGGTWGWGGTGWGDNSGGIWGCGWDSLALPSGASF